MFNPKKHSRVRAESEQSGPRDTPGHDQQRVPAEPLVKWRLCEQRVQRAWMAWLAAPRQSRDACYRTFVSALGEEERAASEIEDAVRLVGSGER